MDLEELKDYVNELTENIEKISDEAESFTKAKIGLDVASAELCRIANGMTSITNNTDKMLDEVRKATVKETLDSLKSSSLRIENECKKITNTAQNIIESNDRMVAEQEKLISTAQNIKESNDRMVAEQEKLISTAQDEIESNNRTMADCQRKLIIMGGIASLCALVAIVLAVMK